MRKNILWWFLGIVGIHALSWLVIFNPSANLVVSVLIGVAVFVLSLCRPTASLAVLGVEYIIGSKGALFKIAGDASNDGGVAIRIILFAAFITGWLIWSLRNRTWTTWKEHVKGRRVYLVLAAVLLYAFGLGIAYQNPFVIADANAWVVWLLLLPVLDIVRHERSRIASDIVPAFIAAFVWMTLFTTGLFFIFTHGFAEVGGELYLWIRRTGLGEVTSYGQGLHRVFFQSHIYAVFVLIASYVGSIFIEKPSTKRLLYVLGLASFLQIFISLSRSLWLGAGAGLVVGTVGALVVVQGRSFLARLWHVVKHGVLWLGLLAVSVCIVWLVYALPFSRLESRAPFRQFFLSRANTQEAAAISRYQLLPILWKKIQEHPILGSGFGATVTYQTKDPRIVQKTGGLYTTYAFEWGWLEHWIKFGIIGIPLMLLILVSLGVRSVSEGESKWMRVAVPSGLLAIAVIHLFSPYLNHPLGIMALIAGEGWLFVNRK